jgi:hypothetical protein
MGLLNWFGKRSDNFENAWDWTTDRLGKTGEWITDDGKRSTTPTTNVGPGGMQFDDDAEAKAKIPAGLNFTQQQLIDAGLIAGPWKTNDNGSGDSGASAAAYVQSLIRGINESFDRQRGALDTNKANSATGIQKNYDAFKQGIANNQALYQQGSAAIQAEISRRMAESVARNTELGNQIGGAVGSIGGNAAAPQAQVAANAATLASSQGFQQDLGNRLDQIVGANQRSVENSGDLVRQGASGNLENNYNAMLNAMLAQREQSLMEAQQAGMSGGGGGGSGTDYSKMNKQAIDKTRYEWGLNNYTPSQDELIQLMLRGGGSDATAAMAYLASQGQNQPQGT